MFEIIFNFFNKTKLFIKKNRKILCFLALGFLFLLTPSQNVKAGIWDEILSAVANLYTLPTKIAIVTSVVMCLLALLLVGVSASILYIVLVYIANIMITYALDVPISPIHPDHADIQVVVDSWNFVNNFVSMFFVLTLAFIGLATILRIKDHEAKQLLPKLLTIAVLINFTPVIIGIIVDMGNIVTNFFIGKAGFDITDMSSLWAFLGALFSLDDIGVYFLSLPGQVLGSPAIVLGEGIKILGQMLVGIIFTFASIYIYLCITSMFFLRVIMLWILTILSPIAFFSYIIPSGSPFRKLFPGILSWEKWWEEFLQWVIVGIPFGLFFYISNAIFNSTAGGAASVPSLGTQFASLGSGINFQGLLIQDFLGPIMDLFVYALALMMLYKGYKISMQAAPAMAQAMIKNTQKLIKTAAIMAATAGAGALAGAAGSAVGGLGSKVGGIGSKMALSKNKVVQGIGKRMNRAAKPLGNLIKQGGQRIDLWNAKNKPKLSDAVKNLTDDGQIEDGEGKSLYQRMLRVRNADLNKLSPENREKTQQAIEEASKKPRFRDEFKDVTKKAAKNGIYSKDIGISLGDITQEDIDEKLEDIQDKIGVGKLELEFEERSGLDANSNQEEFESFKQDFAAKTINFQKMGSVKDVNKKEKTSMEYRLASHGRNSETIADAQKTLSPEKFKEFLHGEGGVISTYDSEEGMKKLGNENEGLLLDILTQGRFSNIEFGQRDNKDIQYEKGNRREGEVDRGKVREVLKKYKAEQSLSADKVKEPKGIIISDSDLTTEAARITAKIGTPGSEERKKADKKARDLGLVGVDDTGFDKLNYAKAEAKRQLIKEKEKLQKTPISEVKKGKLEEQMPTMKTFDVKKKEEKLEKLEEKRKGLEKKKGGIKIDKEKDTYGEQAKKKASGFAIEKRIQLIEKRKAKLEKDIIETQRKMGDISQGISPIKRIDNTIETLEEELRNIKLKDTDTKIEKAKKKIARGEIKAKILSEKAKRVTIVKTPKIAQKIERGAIHKESPYRLFANDILERKRKLEEKIEEQKALAFKIKKKTDMGVSTATETDEYSKLEATIMEITEQIDKDLKDEGRAIEMDKTFKKTRAASTSFNRKWKEIYKKGRDSRAERRSSKGKITVHSKALSDERIKEEKIIKESFEEITKKTDNMIKAMNELNRLKNVIQEKKDKKMVTATDETSYANIKKRIRRLHAETKTAFAIIEEKESDIAKIKKDIRAEKK